jgi:hypothetical protein
MSLLDLVKPAAKPSKTHLILRHLKKHRRATNRELSRYCQRFGARLHELRAEGHIIETEQLKNGLFTYIYKGHRDDQEKRS